MALIGPYDLPIKLYELRCYGPFHFFWAHARQKHRCLCGQMMFPTYPTKWTYKRPKIPVAVVVNAFFMRDGKRIYCRE